MKLLHTSDWHLGMSFKGGVSFEEDQRYVIDKICAIAIEEKVDGIIIAGDVFDRSIASREAVDLYDELITYICSKLKIPVYMIAGNHDNASRLSQCSELLKHSGLFIAGSLKKEAYLVNIDDVDIFLLPWISTERVRSLFPEKAEDINSLEDAYRVVLDGYRDLFVEGHKNILVSHAYIVNAETSVSDHAAEVGKAAMIGAGVFDGFDYVALGHIHRPQQISESIRYSGSPMVYSFGKEEAQEKSVTIIDTDTMELNIIPIPQLHKRLTISGTYEELIDTDYDEAIRNGYILLNVTDSVTSPEIMSKLREKFPHVLEFNWKSFQGTDETISMTLAELEESQDNPLSIFIKYCEDTLNESPNNHLQDMFMKAYEEWIKEVSEA